jgi:hypothetical protein
MVDADRAEALSHTHSCGSLTQVDADKVTRLDEARRAHWEDNVDPLYLSSIGVFPSCAEVALLVWTFLSPAAPLLYSPELRVS